MSNDTGGSLRLPPQFPEGEKAILGGLLLDNDALPKVMALLSPDDFYREAHRSVFRAMSDLSSRNAPVDWITLTAALKEAGLLESVGGPAFLAELADAVPSAANILHYTQKVREKSVLRQLISAATEISTRCYDEHGNIDEFLDEAEQVIFKVGESRIQSGFTHVQDLMKDSFATIESLYER
jgi:replicative DNA helicase